MAYLLQISFLVELKLDVAKGYFMFGKWQMILAISFTYIIISCKQISHQESEVDGIPSLLADIPTPRPITQVQVRSFIKGVASPRQGMKSVEAPSLRGPDLLKNQLYRGIVDAGGLPRWQLSSVMRELLSPSTKYCQNISCARVFEVKASDVDRYLDGLYKEVTNSPSLRQTANKSAFSTLVGSLRREPGVHSARGGIQNDKSFLWDNWFVYFKNTYYRFSLEAPRTFPQGFRPQFDGDFKYPRNMNLSGRKASPDDRHHMAQIGLYTSKTGRDWQYQGVAIGTSDDPKQWDSHVIWSGNAHDIGGRLVVPYTGRSKTIDPVTGDKWLQKIGIAVLDEDTGAFKKIGKNPVLDPTAKDSQGQIIAKNLGYDISSDDLVIMAWRDPYLYVDQAKGEVHMFFAAKAEKSLLAKRGQKSEANGAIGHAVARASNLNQWQLLPPLHIPAAYSQFELPIVIKRNQEYILFSSVVELGQDTRQQSLRAYRSNRLDGQWKKIKPGDDMVMNLERIYGVNIAVGANGKDYYGVSFDDKNLTLSPLMKMSWDERGVPHFPREEEW